MWRQIQIYEILLQRGGYSLYIVVVWHTTTATTLSFSHSEFVSATTTPSYSYGVTGGSFSYGVTADMVGKGHKVHIFLMCGITVNLTVKGYGQFNRNTLCLGSLRNTLLMRMVTYGILNDNIPKVATHLFSGSAMAAKRLNLPLSSNSVAEDFKVWKKKIIVVDCKHKPKTDKSYLSDFLHNAGLWSQFAFQILSQSFELGKQGFFTFTVFTAAFRNARIFGQWRRMLEKRRKLFMVNNLQLKIRKWLGASYQV